MNFLSITQRSPISPDCLRPTVTSRRRPPLPGPKDTRGAPGSLRLYQQAVPMPPPGLIKLVFIIFSPPRDPSERAIVGAAC